jgi:hypothetical protein
MNRRIGAAEHKAIEVLAGIIAAGEGVGGRAPHDTGAAAALLTVTVTGSDVAVWLARSRITAVVWLPLAMSWYQDRLYGEGRGTNTGAVQLVPVTPAVRRPTRTRRPNPQGTFIGKARKSLARRAVKQPGCNSVHES